MTCSILYNYVCEVEQGVDIGLDQSSYCVSEGSSVDIGVKRGADRLLIDVTVDITVRSLGSTESTDFSGVPTTTPVIVGEDRTTSVSIAGMSDSDHEGLEVFEISIANEATGSGETINVNPRTALVFVKNTVLCTPTCSNGGICVTGNECVYPDGFYGDTCDDPDPICVPACLNNGYCVPGTPDDVCVCPPGYSGIMCEIQDPVCIPACINNGYCVPGTPDDVCVCPPGYSGIMCEIEELVEIVFGDTSYSVREDIGTVDVTVVRRGSMNNGISEIDVIPSSDNSVAKAGKDYEPFVTRVSFGALDVLDEDVFTFPITINDDHVVEQLETFHLVLRNVHGAVIGYPNVAEVTIEDNDVRYCFARSSYTVGESAGRVDIVVERTGSLHLASFVVLYTVDGTATGGGLDFVSISSSDVQFDEDQSKATVVILIVNDVEFEESEVFSVRIVSDIDDEPCGNNIADVTITNEDFECEVECQNDGVCVGINTCLCAEGFTGDYCEGERAQQGLSNGAVIGTIIGVIVGILLISVIVLGLYLVARQRRNEQVPIKAEVQPQVQLYPYNGNVYGMGALKY